MVCEEPIRASIWHALHHYAYKDAIFLAERLYSEVNTGDTLHLLATCYYQGGMVHNAYSLLQSKGCLTPLCRILFAKCCFELDKLAEGEMALTGGCLTNGKPIEIIASEFGNSAGYALAMLGQICRKSDQAKRAIECFKSSLKYNPCLWNSFEALCNLGEKPDPSEYFKASACPKIFTSLTNRESMTTGLSTATMGTTTSNVNNKRQAEEYIATENLDPSQNNTPSLSTSTTPGTDLSDNSGFLVPPTPMSCMSENRVRARVGRNLLGGNQSSSPLTASFGVLPADTPIDNMNFMAYMTPSPSVNANSDIHTGHTPKAPVKKGVRRSDSASTKTSSVITTTQTSTSSSLILTRASPQTTSSQSILASPGKKTVRRSTRLFSMSSSSTEEIGSDIKKLRSTRTSTVRKTRRQTRSTSQQPLGPCVSNVIQGEPSPVQQDKPVIKGSPSNHGMEGLMSLLRQIGTAYQKLCSYECKQAIALFSALPPHQYNTGWVLTQVGHAYFETAEYQMAEKIFSEVQRIDPKRLNGMEIYSTTLWHLQKEVALSSLAQDLTETDRTSPQAWCATGNCFSLHKEHDTAIKFFQRAVQVDPNFTYAYTLLGHEYVLTEELDRAMSCYRMAIKADPRHYNAWYGIGMIYYKQEKFNLAEVHFRKALSINPSSSVLYCHIGVVLHAMKKSEAALATINKAMSIDPKNPLCKFHRASILFSIEKYQKALQELEELKKIVPREALVYFLMGKVYKKLGQTHLAQMNFSWAIDLDPKGANNQIKDAIDKRYLPDDDDSTMGLGCNESSMDQSGDMPDEEAMGLEMDSESSSSMVLF